MYTIEHASNPVYGNAEKTVVVLSVKFVEFDEPMPFGATSYDPMPYGVELFNRAVAGEFGPIADYVAPIATQPQPTVQGAQTL